MKKLNHIKSCLLLVLLATAAFMQSGCKKDATSSSKGTPVITSIRNYVAHPGDSLLSSVGTGQWVVISGKNLKGALAINFDGVKGSFNDAWFSDTSAIALIPAVIAFPTVPSDKLNTIQYITNHGQTTFSFPIVAPAPTISGVSNEDANPGDSVKINGLSFFFVKSVIYGGINITNFKSSNDGTSISLAVPAGITQTGGIVSVETKSGKAATVYSIHNLVNGVLNNYDNINNFSWGSGTSNSAASYPGNTGYYGIMKASNVPAGDGSWWNDGRSINTNSAQWIPQANMKDTLSHYVLKFEISVTKPWTNGSIQIVKDYSWTYSALYHPWKTSTGATVPFTTKGWQTVTIPLSNFVDSKGFPAPTLSDLLGSAGAGAINVTFTNDGSSTVQNFEAAIDNIRVVRIK
ncbi:glycan-binding surface protein [Mucilaginibacter sp. cycad4]|uniref:glycan-binding surface protein n=1 Tax=Mucilaginibacter sp. cycad4 TaxID=3342096 RepID=UPI002AAC165C|nr:glycan-binding surface protein [Mucilaginibacter gossypii]WPV01727.1 glycan-binding surface protein [Mucilaginibacter gossypii]